MPARECSRTACSRPAVSTLTFVYADSTAVLGPLARTSEPHTYDLCGEHAGRMTAPRGWELMKIPGSSEVPDELVALADAVRHRPGATVPSGVASDTSRRAGSASSRPDPTATAHRSAARHLYVLRSEND